MGKRRFWGELFGYNRGVSSTASTRGGSTGIKGHIRGWDLGVEVVGRINEDGKDEFEIWTTGGSHDPGRKLLVATVNPEGMS